MGAHYLIRPPLPQMPILLIAGDMLDKAFQEAR